jgi:hypothetical protein
MGTRGRGKEERREDKKGGCFHSDDYVVNNYCVPNILTWTNNKDDILWCPTHKSKSQGRQRREGEKLFT